MIYEWECKQCNHKWDVITAISKRDEPNTCPKCSSKETKRLISAFGKHSSWSKWNPVV